ncbi:hypothetical protein L5515_009327 [Caenorhabditis briggsae]|uniref:Uncharacterized protein n=1 Tax=Caenorhabditis briggsae TaxID=6238 RepID=A0AAE9JNJ7_CAEBR|nr:hypothetical protein L5515_009327 [Caenorhabditis briggsae]
MVASMHRPTDGFQRLACLSKAKNQKFSADNYRSRAQNSVTTRPFTVSTGHTTSERNSTDRKTKRKKKQPRAASRLDFCLMDTVLAKKTWPDPSEKKKHLSGHP